MLDLRDDGTIGIDFGSKTVVLHRPTLGIVEQLDFKREAIRTGIPALAAEIGARDPKPTPEETTIELRRKSKDLCIEWWETAAKLFEVEFPPVDEWPSYLVFGKAVLGTVIDHWNEVPLARSGQLVARESPTLE